MTLIVMTALRPRSPLVLEVGSMADFHGEIVAWRRGFVELGNVNVHGQVRAEMFSQVLLFQTQLDAPAVCTSGSDLTCTGQATAATAGCPSAGSCIAPAAPAIPRPGE